MNVKFLQNYTHETGHWTANEGAVWDIERGLANRLIKDKIAIPFDENDELKAILAHLESKKTPAQTIVLLPSFEQEEE